MVSTTISLERSAYESLKRAKLPGESFSQTVRRLTKAGHPTLRPLVGLFPQKDGDAMARLIADWRAGDVADSSKGRRK